MALNNSKLLSGRVVVTPYTDLSNSRYEFLGLSQAEPNLGTGANGSILTISTDNQRVFSNVITVSSNTSTATITNLSVTGDTNLGAVGNLTITGGNVGYVLTTDGAGNLSWQEDTSNGIPGGSNTQVQFNSSGAFGASANLTFDGTTLTANDIIDSSLTASKPVFTNGSKNLVSTGTLGVDQGGTGLTTLTANNVILGNGTSTPSFVAPSTNGNILTSNGTTWVSSTPAASGLSQAKATMINFVFSI